MTTAARKPSRQTAVPAWAAAAASVVREARAGTATAAGGGRERVTVAGGPAAWAAWAASCLDHRKVTGRSATRRRAAHLRSGEWGRRRRAALRQKLDRGMATAEYAMGTLAACAFAAVLFKVVTSGAVSSALSSVISKALHVQV
ncbi:DUF4244 domain-containing protein [Streptomyces sp. NPDC053542]|uniref:DUF4244 domain-containing protein n=1 Tax=Streptomyces sp. NPDC053542 TaxID=3365710 RepID=UPI0037D785E4